MTDFVIHLHKSIVPACDVAHLGDLERIVRETSTVSGVGAFKIGLQLAIVFGLKKVVEVMRSYTDVPIIYDHQKGGNDIPGLASGFSNACWLSGVNAVILFPFAGPATMREWIKACQGLGLTVIVGGHMTHGEFLSSEGGFIHDLAPARIYEMAAKLGVREFVIPGNKPNVVLGYREILNRITIDYGPSDTASVSALCHTLSVSILAVNSQ